MRHFKYDEKERIETVESSIHCVIDRTKLKPSL